MLSRYRLIYPVLQTASLPFYTLQLMTLHYLSTDWWLWELLSWLTSAASITALVVVLSIHNGRPLPQWPLGITLNTFISLIATLAKASAIVPVAESIGQLKWLWFKQQRKLFDFQAFDDASRGPWGSLQLLKCTKARYV